MRTIATILLLSVLALAQNPEASKRPGTSPVPLVSSPLPEQDITITVHLSSELATAIENDRRQIFVKKEDASGATILSPMQPSLPDQVVFRLQDYFRAILQRFPSSTLKGLQDAVSAKQQEEAAAREKAATVTRKK